MKPKFNRLGSAFLLALLLFITTAWLGWPGHLTLAQPPQQDGDAGTTISGHILLQGRTDHSGIEILLSPEACPTLVQTTPVITGPNVINTATGADGSFEILPLADQTYGCIQAIHPGYLIWQQASPQGDLGSVTLLGGDVTGDGTIDIYDLALVGSRYGDDDPTADVNGDGVVSIFDLTITAANYLRQGPVTGE